MYDMEVQAVVEDAWTKGEQTIGARERRWNTTKVIRRVNSKEIEHWHRKKMEIIQEGHKRVHRTNKQT